jgi:hypothetical protein
MDNHDHPLDAGLRALGVDPAALDTDLLAALRDAHEQRRAGPAPSLDAAYAAHYAPGVEDARRRAAEATRTPEGTP